MKVPKVLLLTFVLGCVFLFGNYSKVQAATFNIAPGDVYGSEGLVSAINTANTNGEDDVINLSPNSDYVLTYIYNPWDIGNPYMSYPSGTPLITSNITINGNGSTIRRDLADPDQFRIITIWSGGSLTLNDTTITGGRLPSYNLGGGIMNGLGSGLLTIRNSKILDNQAAYGAGISTGWSSVTIENSEISDNIATNNGGGLSMNAYNATNVIVNVSDSLFKNNRALYGGGIFSGVSELTVTGTTFETNYARDIGGGLYFHSFYNSGRLNLMYNTFLHNDAPGAGTAMVLADTIEANITGNRFSRDGSVPFLVKNSFVSQYGVPLEVHNNCFPEYSPTFNYGALYNMYPSGYINAQNNWWGHPTGPSGLIGNEITGSGSWILGANITYQPFLTEGCPLDFVNHAPTVSANGTYTVNEGATVQLSATGADQDNDNLTYAWDLDNDSIFETAGQSVPFYALTLDGPNAYSVSVQVSDGSLTATDSTTVSVLNVNPTAELSLPTQSAMGATFFVSLINSFDPGIADNLAGLRYSFACDGQLSSLATDYVSASLDSSANCSFNSIGTYTVLGKIYDKDNGSSIYTGSVDVIYNFTPANHPIDPNALNEVKAGRTVPVKFSLGGNYGLGIFASGYPKSESVVCNSNSAVNGVEETLSAGSGLSYDPVTGLYTYLWKTESSWSGCRQFVIRFVDGTYFRVNFSFR